MPWADPANEPALEADSVLEAWFVEIALDGVTLALMTGTLADIPFDPGDGEITFTVDDDDYGSLAGPPEGLSIGMGIETQRVQIVLLPPSDAAAVTLKGLAIDGSAVRCWYSPIDQGTGLPVGDPDLRFSGVVDVPVHAGGMGRSVVVLDCITAAEALHDAGEGLAMNSASHKLIWPGETLFDLSGYLYVPDYWGATEAGVAAALAGPGGNRPGVIQNLLGKLRSRVLS